MSDGGSAGRSATTGGGGSAGGASAVGSDSMWNELRQKDHTILVLQKKLAHFRSWVASVHSRAQQVNPASIKNAKRLYVGGLPADATEEELRTFFQGLMAKAGGLAAPGQAVLGVKITPDKGFAFVEFRSVEETSNAMAFDGVAYKDAYLKLRRPSNYDPSSAILLGPMVPDPTMDTSTLDICRTLVEDSPNKLFVGGLPCDWSDEQVKELLLPYGLLKSFNLVMDKATGKSKGYAFCEFSDDSIADVVIRSLNMKRMGNKSLTIKRALEGSIKGVPGQGPYMHGHMMGPPMQQWAHGGQHPPSGPAFFAKMAGGMPPGGGHSGPSHHGPPPPPYGYGPGPHGHGHGPPHVHAGHAGQYPSPPGPPHGGPMHGGMPPRAPDTPAVGMPGGTLSALLQPQNPPPVPQHHSMMQQPPTMGMGRMSIRDPSSGGHSSGGPVGPPAPAGGAHTAAVPPLGGAELSPGSGEPLQGGSARHPMHSLHGAPAGSIASPGGPGAHDASAAPGTANASLMGLHSLW